VYFKNLDPCVKEGQGGYRCLGGDALVGLTQQNGRNICKLGATRYLSFSRTVPYRTTSCTFDSYKQRHLDQGQELVRKGPNTLENDSKLGKCTSQWLPPQGGQAVVAEGLFHHGARLLSAAMGFSAGVEHPVDREIGLGHRTPKVCKQREAVALGQPGIRGSDQQVDIGFRSGPPAGPRAKQMYLCRRDQLTDASGLHN
jgi:hypothetical protein